MSNTKSKKPTNQDVARIAGVSVATVSYVVNGRTDQKISEETKKKVWHAINFLGYIPNPHATAIKSSAKDIVMRASKSNGLLKNLEAFAVLKEFTELCANNGYTVTFSAETEPSRVSATACVCIGLSAEEFHALANENFAPVIAVDSIIGDPVFYQVCNDYDEIKRRAELQFGSNYTFVAIEPNDAQLKEEILSALPDTVFVRELADLKKLELENVAISNFVLGELLVNCRNVQYVCDKGLKLQAILDCIEKAVNREKVADEMHYIKI